jgi:hypothetical protein
LQSSTKEVEFITVEKSKAPNRRNFDAGPRGYEDRVDEAETPGDSMNTGRINATHSGTTDIEIYREWLLVA